MDTPGDFERGVDFSQKVVLGALELVLWSGLGWTCVVRVTCVVVVVVLDALGVVQEVVVGVVLVMV